jgi:hypothetical protein
VKQNNLLSIDKLKSTTIKEQVERSKTKLMKYQHSQFISILKAYNKYILKEEGSSTVHTIEKVYLKSISQTHILLT